jgi:hypothetical protein
MKAAILAALLPFNWEDCDDLGFCVDTICGRYWIVREGGKYRAQFVFMEHERSEQKFVSEPTDEASARKAAWDHYLMTISKAFTEDGRPAPKPVEKPEVDGSIVAWLAVWANGEPEVATSEKHLVRGDEKPKLTGLTLKKSGEIAAWRWTDGGGYNAGYRYSFVDPREDEQEVEDQGAESVASCQELYRAE